MPSTHSHPLSNRSTPILVGALIALGVIVAALLVGAPDARSQVPGIGDGEVTGERLGGADRFETSVEISMFQFPDGADNVYLARADAFPDALSAAALTGGPVLLVPQCDDLPDVIRDEVGRLAPSNVYALGGEAAVCDAVLDEAVEAAQSDDGSETPTPTETETGEPTPTETESGSELPLPLPSGSETETESETEQPVS